MYITYHSYIRRMEVVHAALSLRSFACLDMDEAEGRELIERICVLEEQIESIKKQLRDTSSIDDLTRRIANCENLAGISHMKDE